MTSTINGSGGGTGLGNGNGGGTGLGNGSGGGIKSLVDSSCKKVIKEVVKEINENTTILYA